MPLFVVSLSCIDRHRKRVQFYRSTSTYTGNQDAPHRHLTSASVAAAVLTTSVSCNGKDGFPSSGPARGQRGRCRWLWYTARLRLQLFRYYSCILITSPVQYSPHDELQPCYAIFTTINMPISNKANKNQWNWSKSKSITSCWLKLKNKSL